MHQFSAVPTELSGPSSRNTSNKMLEKKHRRPCRPSSYLQQCQNPKMILVFECFQHHLFWSLKIHSPPNGDRPCWPRGNDWGCSHKAMLRCCPIPSFHQMQWCLRGCKSYLRWWWWWWFGGLDLKMWIGLNIENMHVYCKSASTLFHQALWRAMPPEMRNDSWYRDAWYIYI